MVLNCSELVEMVTDFLDGALGSTERQRFMAHLADCPGCETYLDQFRQTIGVLAALPAQTLPDPARDRLVAAFRDRQRP